jgi:hypothetical protein
VLGKFPAEALAAASARFSDIYSSVELILLDKCDEAMNKFSK